MSGIGQSSRRLLGALARWPLGAIGVALAVLALWGFTVDDAFIIARYAHHIAIGDGYVFNAGGPTSDGVTPLPFALLLAPLARTSARRCVMSSGLTGSA